MRFTVPERIGKAAERLYSRCGSTIRFAGYQLGEPLPGYDGNVSSGHTKPRAARGSRARMREVRTLGECVRTGLVWPNSADERAAIGNPYGTVYSIIEPFCSRYSDFLSRGQTRPYHTPPAFGTQTLVSEIAEQSGRRPGAPSPALHRQSRPVRRAIDRIAPIPSSATAPSQTGFGSSRHSKPLGFLPHLSARQKTESGTSGRPVGETGPAKRLFSSTARTTPLRRATSPPRLFLPCVPRPRIRVDSRCGRPLTPDNK